MNNSLDNTPWTAFLRVSKKRFFQISIGFFLLLLIFIAPYDQELSVLGQNLPWKGFAEFQHQTFFEHGRFGGSDFGLFFQIGCALLLLGCFLPKHLRPHFLAEGLMGRLGRFSLFISISSLYSGLILIQGIKFAWGRVRPYAVFDDDLGLFTEWYELGLHTIQEGKFAGSFPSGHVASATAFLGILWLWPRSAQGLRLVFWLVVCLLCLLMWFLMTVGRVMARDHWPTDGVVSFLLVLASYAYFAEVLFPEGRWPRQGDVFAPVPWRSVGSIFGWSICAIGLLWIVREIVLASGL